MESRELHVVLGAGQVGPRVAELLLARGHRVRIARKSAAPSRVPGLETVAIDVRDPKQVAEAAAGASVVYSCVNPLYHEWAEKLLPMVRGIAQGTRAAGARLVALDNLYMYGDTTFMNEATRVAPVSKKGKLRAEAGDILLDSGAAIGRAADFFGPNTPLALFGEQFWTRVLAGKSAQVFGEPDQLHTYSFTPDVAAGLVALGSRPGTEGVWMLPVQRAESTTEVVARFASALGQRIPISVVPTWMLRALGVFHPMLREMAEMTYQWKQPYVVDDRKFRAAFGFGATAWEPAIDETIAWARATYGAPAARAA